jgi:hypothetical protein
MATRLAAGNNPCTDTAARPPLQDKLALLPSMLRYEKPYLSAPTGPFTSACRVAQPTLQGEMPGQSSSCED